MACKQQRVFLQVVSLKHNQPETLKQEMDDHTSSGVMRVFLNAMLSKSKRCNFTL